MQQQSLARSMTYIDLGTDAHRRAKFKWSLMPRLEIKGSFDIDATNRS